MLSNNICRLWRALAVICAVSAFAMALTADDPSSTLAVAASGVCFFLMSEWRHDDLDF